MGSVSEYIIIKWYFFLNNDLNACCVSMYCELEVHGA